LSTENSSILCEEFVTGLELNGAVVSEIFEFCVRIIEQSLTLASKVPESICGILTLTCSISPDVSSSSIGSGFNN